ncbi:MAG: T9SS type A sorting domain-containing protein [Crocinitomicaceae bacterium]
MKKIASLILFAVISVAACSQVSFTITEPASIAGGYEFTSNGDAPNWGLADLLDPNDAVQDTVVLVDDGLPGLNAQGVPFANEGCNTLINDLTGKIAFVYRYDGASTNDCYAGTKVLNAQNAGAVGVILVNRTEGVYGYNGTTDGPATNIPFAFISKSDGEIIRAKLDAGEDVVAFIGSKLGLYPDDVGIVKNNTIAPKYSVSSSKTAATGSEFGFNVGTTIYNYGQNNQNNVTITASVTGPSGLWTETVGPFTIASGDSIDVFTGGLNNIPAFSLASYNNGNYKMKYSVDIGLPDESNFDNEIEYIFSMTDNIISYCNIDTNSNLPEANTYTRSNEANFSPCIVYKDANSSRLAATGMHFSAGVTWNSGVELEGTIADVLLYKWNDNFIDLNDPSFGFDDLEILASATYDFGPNMEEQMVFVPFDEKIQFENNQRYLACVQTYESYMTIGYSTRVNYSRNFDRFLQPIIPISAGSQFYAGGFGGDRVPAISLEVFDSELLAVDNTPAFDCKVFPNPTSDFLSISSQELNEAHIEIVDMTGRLIASKLVNSNQVKIDVSEFTSGIYFVRITDSKGDTVQKKFVKG